jgi:hypothetical protein
MPSPPPFSEEALRVAVAEATCWADTLRLLGYSAKGANYRTVQRWARIWGVPTGHFDPNLRRGVPQPAGRKVERPSYEQLMSDLAATSFVAVGRQYGVSDNAVRKWVRWYEQARDADRDDDADRDSREEAA